ncbi:MAG: hypothetical protein MZV64_30670 [Ignavibacteriales bacterium]|nr:hypothetical protein [Ignavibacteriales bacterium]
MTVEADGSREGRIEADPHGVRSRLRDDAGRAGPCRRAVLHHETAGQEGAGVLCPSYQVNLSNT